MKSSGAPVKRQFEFQLFYILPMISAELADLLSGDDVEPVYSNLFKIFDDEQQQWLVHTMQED